MDEKQIEILRIKIQNEIVELERTVEGLEGTLAPVEPDVAIGRLSRLDSMQNQSINEARRSQSKQRILRLQDALERLEDPDFGYCEECGEPIALKRIMALPEVTLCIDCAE
ncbi:MAG: TraR/DksA family transcriptional regulator [Desulfovibrio sp.]